MRVYLGVAGAGWGVFVASLFMTEPPAWLMLGSFVATCGAMLSMLLFVRCPRCRAALPQIGFAAALAPATANRFRRCPACDADLD